LHVNTSKSGLHVNTGESGSGANLSKAHRTVVARFLRTVGRHGMLREWGTSTEMTSVGMTSVEVIFAGITSSWVDFAGMASVGMTFIGMASAEITSIGMTPIGIMSAGVVSVGITFGGVAFVGITSAGRKDVGAKWNGPDGSSRSSSPRWPADPSRGETILRYCGASWSFPARSSVPNIPERHRGRFPASWHRK